MIYIVANIFSVPRDHTNDHSGIVLLAMGLALVLGSVLQGFLEAPIGLAYFLLGTSILTIAGMLSLTGVSDEERRRRIYDA